MGAGKSPVLPRIILHQSSMAVVHVDSELGRVDIGPGTEPVVIPFKQGMGDGLLLFYPEIAAPLVIPDEITLFRIRADRFRSSCDGIIHGGQAFSA